MQFDNFRFRYPESKLFCTSLYVLSSNVSSDRFWSSRTCFYTGYTAVNLGVADHKNYTLQRHSQSRSKNFDNDFLFDYRMKQIVDYDNNTNGDYYSMVLLNVCIKPYRYRVQKPAFYFYLPVILLIGKQYECLL